MNVEATQNLRAKTTETQHPSEGSRCVVYYDGVCVMCNGFVTFLAARDRGRRLYFAPLQGDTFATLKARQPELAQIDSMVCETPSVGSGEQPRLHTHSSAALHALAALGGAWTVARLFLVIPRFLRDAVYRFVATVRYAVFGKRDETACPLPSPELAARLLP